MSENIFWVLVTKIKEGELQNLKDLMKEMNEYTESNEPDALAYEWFISGDEKYCHLFEQYKDSAATIIHIKSFMKNFVKGMLDPMGVIYMEPIGGFTR